MFNLFYFGTFTSTIFGNPFLDNRSSLCLSIIRISYSYTCMCILLHHEAHNVGIRSYQNCYDVSATLTQPAVMARLFKASLA